MWEFHGSGEAEEGQKDVGMPWLWLGMRGSKESAHERVGDKKKSAQGQSGGVVSIEPSVCSNDALSSI
jgi:hypothetical protein